MPSIIEKRGVAFLVDIENIFIAAYKDTGIEIPEKRTEILKVLPSCLLRAATAFGPIECAYGALSLPRQPHEQSKNNGHSPRIKDAIAMQLAFVGAGIPTILTPAGPDAADEALVQHTLRLIRNTFITTFVIATGDGGKPFQELLRILTEKRKNAHVVVYDILPHIIRNREYPCTHERIESSVREALIKPFVPKEHSFPEPEESHPPANYEHAMKAFKKGNHLGIEPYDTHIVLAMKTIKKAFKEGRMQDLKIGTIAHIVKEAFLKEGHKVTREDALKISYVITNLSGVFKREMRYSVDPEKCELFELA